MIGPLLTLSLILLGPVDEAETLFGKAVEMATRGQAKKADELFAELMDRFPSSGAAGKVPYWRGDNRLVGFRPLARGGPASNRIDLVVMSEAFDASAGQRRRFARLADDIPRLLSQTELFGEFLSYFNVMQADLTSVDDRADYRDHLYNTALNARKVGMIDQIQIDRGRVQDYLDALPQADDQAIVIVRDEGAGSGLRGVAVVPGEPNREELLRVLGFSLGGLAAEYSSSNYVSEGLPSEAVNVAATDDPRHVPWAHWIKALPNKVGVYEGGAGRYKGVWRPTADGCIMRGGRDYCYVCREAMILTIYSRVCPIDAATPNTEPVVVRSGDKGVVVDVMPIQPKWHRLHVFFTMIKEGEGVAREGLRLGGKRGDGPNPGRGRWDRSRPEGEKVEAKIHKERGREVHSVDLGRLVLRERLTPGRYFLTAWVHDTGRVKNEVWVLQDPIGLLDELMTWEILVEPK